LTCVSSSPSKIPYGEFSPVRLQTNFQTKDLRADRAGLSAVHIRLRPSLIPWLSVESGLRARIHGLFAAHGASAQNPLSRIAPIGRGPSQPPHVRPEALGSPEGYVVLPGHRLLWPHPRLWDGRGASPAFVRPRKRPRAATQSFPNLLHMTVRPCRLPYPGGPRSALGCRFLRSDGLRLGSTGSATTSSNFEAAEFALCYGLAVC